jgi:hypothetical protein
MLRRPSRLFTSVLVAVALSPVLATGTAIAQIHC